MRKSGVNVEAIAAVRKSIQVSLQVEEAFRLFTEGLSTWWPLQSHSIGEERAETCTFEGRVGGRIYETLIDATQADWGRVLVWNPPHSVVFTWHPGRPIGSAQEVEVTFTAVANGTLVELVHRGWENYGELAMQARDGYESGWDYVLGHYLERAGS